MESRILENLLIKISLLTNLIRMKEVIFSYHQRRSHQEHLILVLILWVLSLILKRKDFIQSRPWSLILWIFNSLLSIQCLKNATMIIIRWRTSNLAGRETVLRFKVFQVEPTNLTMIYMMGWGTWATKCLNWQHKEMHLVILQELVCRIQRILEGLWLTRRGVITSLTGTLFKSI